MSNTVEIRLAARDEASSVINGVVGNLRGMVAQMAAMAGVTAAGAGLGALAVQGVKFNSVMEDSKLGLAALIMSTTSYTDAAGKAASKQEALAAAMSAASKVQEELKVAAKTTAASYEDLNTAFQTAYGPATAVGITNLSKLKDVVVQGSLAVNALGLDSRQMSQELRAIFTGEQGPSNTLNRVLGITKEQLDAVRASGGDVAQMLLDKLAPFATAATASMGNLSVMVSNLKDSMAQGLGTAMGPLFVALKGLIADVSKQLEAAQPRMNEIGAKLAEGMEKAGPAIAALIDFLLRLVEAVVDFGAKLAELPLADVLGVLTDLIRATDGWAVAIAAVVYALGGLKGIEGIFGAALGGIKALGAQTVVLAGQIETAAGLTAGLSGALATLGTGAALAGAIWGIGKIVEGLRVAGELMDELDTEKRHSQAGGEAVLDQLAGFRRRLAEPGGNQQDRLEEIRKTWEMTNRITAELKEQKRITADTYGDYRKLVNDIKASLPALRDARGVTGATKPSGLTGEQRKELERQAKEAAKIKADLARDLAKAVGDFEKEQAGVLELLGDRLGAGVAAIRAKYGEAQEVAAKWAKLQLVSPERAAQIAGGLTAAMERQIADLTEAFLRQARTVPGVYQKAGQMAKLAVAQTREEVADLSEEWRRGLITAQEAAAGMARALYRTAETAGDGVKAATHAIMAEVKMVGQITADYLVDVWHAVGRGFEDSVFAVVTGRASDLGDILKGVFDDIGRAFSKMVTDMVRQWLLGSEKMGQPAAGSYPGVGGAGGGGKSGWGSAGAYLGAGVAGFGIGSMVGAGGIGNQIGGAVGGVGGLIGGTAVATALTASGAIAAGSMMGSVVPIIGTIVGALVGAIIGGVFNKSTEKKFSVYTARLVDVAANDQIGRSVQNSRDNIIGMMGDLAALTGGSVKDATDQTRKVINDWLKGRRYEVHAGSQEDIDKDFERLLGEVVPSEMLKQLFGFSIKPYEPTTELPGIRGVGNFHMGNIDEGKEGPLFKMLETLGFARDRIVEIGRQIDARPAEEFIQWLNRLVGVAAASKKLFAEMGKSFADLDAEWSGKEKAGAKGAFTERATAIADALAAIENFSGDDQLKRMEEAQRGAAEFWNDVLDYVARLREAMNQMSAGIRDQRQKMRDFLNPLGADETASNAWGEVSGVWGKLANATDPAEVEKAVAEARAAIDKVFSVMAERINRGRALLEKLGGLGSISDELTRDGIEAVDPLRAWGIEMFSMQRKVEDAARQSGLAQIQTLEEVGASAEEMYANLKGFLADIASTSASINKSIDSQIWELGVGEMDPQGQAGAITGRIRELQEQLKIATSPAEIAAITSEIQGLTNRYVGTFGKDDPKRQEAIDWATEQLERARGLANETLDVLKAQAEAYAKQIEETITTVTGLLGKNIGDATTTIGQLSHTLGELDRVMREAMGRLGDEILTAAQPIREALEEATKLFTDSIDAASGAIGGPGGGGGGGGGGRTPLADAANLGASNLVSFAEEVAAATERLRALKPGSGTATEQQTGGATSGQRSSGRVTAAEVIPLVRRHSGQLAQRVG